jgi:hypothetical protein
MQLNTVLRYTYSLSCFDGGLVENNKLAYSHVFIELEFHAAVTHETPCSYFLTTPVFLKYVNVISARNITCFNGGHTSSGCSVGCFSCCTLL